MNVILYQKGYFPGLSVCLKSLRLYSPDCRVHLLGSDIPDHDYIDEKRFWSKAGELEQVYRHHSVNDFEFEKRCFRRWLVMAEFAREFQLESYFTCDTDVLVMENLDQAAELFKPTEFTLPLVAMFVFRPECIARFGDFILDYYRKPDAPFRQECERKFREGKIFSVCDMLLLGEFAKNYRTVEASNAVYRSVCIEHNLGEEEHFWSKDGYKLIQFLFGQPYGLTQGGKVIRFLTLHCWGKAKEKMSWYLDEALKTKL